MLTRLRAKVAAERSAYGYSVIRGFATVVANSLRWRRAGVAARVRAWLARSPAFRRALACRRLARADRTGNRAAALASIGDLNLAVGDVDRALEAWKASFAADPAAFDVYDRYAYHLWQRGEWDAAFDAWVREERLRREYASRRKLDRLPFTLLDRNWTGVIGMMGHLETYVKQQILDQQPLERTLLLARPKSTQNRAYLDYWRRYFPQLVDTEEGYMRFVPLAEAMRRSFWAWESTTGELKGYFEVGADVERRWEAAGRGPLLELDADHRERGRARLEALGVPGDAWFVTVHVREGPYHDVRNADPLTYASAIEAVVERGGWVIRMGDPMLTPTKLPEMEHVVDYAHSDAKSDWMDVFLWADCRFLIGTCSGPVQIPGTFGVPVVQTNWCPVAPRYWNARDLQIPKLYWSERERRLLTFAESIRPPLGFAQLPLHFDEHGVRVIDNTPEEIAEVVTEMLERADGAATYTAEDDELQASFDALEPPVRYRVPGGGARRGREFLRRYSDLLERR